MFYRIFAPIVAFLLTFNIAFAAEHGAEAGKEKAKPPEKPRPDSAVSMILGLPVVKKWQEYIDAKGDESHMEVWGEAIKQVQGSKCWSIVVAEINDEDKKVWKRFCAMQTGLEIWVEAAREDGEDEIKYLTYENWLKDCKPRYDSPGKC